VRGMRDGLGSDAGRWVRVLQPASPSGPDTSRLWNGPLISEAALWGLNSLLLLPPSSRAAPPQPTTTALTSLLSISPRPPPPGEGVLGSWGSEGPRIPIPDLAASSSAARPGALPTALGPAGRVGAWSHAWFRLERREDRTSGPVPAHGSHPRLDEDRSPGASRLGRLRLGLVPAGPTCRQAAASTDPHPPCDPRPATRDPRARS
jgi:hypothetical protein